MMMPTSHPKYRHTCKSCFYLGRWHYQQLDHFYDLYFCRQCFGRSTVIARFGDGTEDYNMGFGLGSVLPELAEAERRAKTRGFLDQESIFALDEDQS